MGTAEVEEVEGMAEEAEAGKTDKVVVAVVEDIEVEGMALVEEVEDNLLEDKAEVVGEVGILAVMALGMAEVVEV